MWADPRRTLGKYRLIAEIARGGMGIVYLAMVQGPGGFNKLVVIKELKPDLVEEPAYLQMFLDEARLAARLNHPNIVQTNEVGNDGERYFMAMDYLDGRGLDRVRRRSQHTDQGLTLAMQLRVICDVLAGLDYAHKFADFDGTLLGIVHRDVSPQNVFITFEGQVSLLDFGIAKTVDSINETKAGVLKGKVSYMAPEQARGQKVDARADVFAAGVLLWEALAGRRMSQGQSEREMMTALVTTDLPRASTVAADVPMELDEICARAMAFDRNRRYASAGVFQEDLERYLTKTTTNVSAREVGAYVTKLFHNDRAKTKALIEAHIAQARGETIQDELPSIDISYSPPLATPVGATSQVPTIDASTGQLSRLSNLSAAAPSGPLPNAPTRSRRFLVPVVIGGAVAAAAVMFIATRAKDAPPAPLAAIAHKDPPAPPPPAAAEVADPPKPNQPNLIDIEIRVAPVNAIVTIDGATVSGNPFHGKYIGDGAMHQIRAVALGYVEKAEAIAFNANVTLDFSLEHVPQVHPIGSRPAPVHVVGRTPVHPAEPAHVEPPPPPPEPTPTDVNPNGGVKPRRTIDPTNPYGGK